jgi:membrane associated rhomboid family serine protease
MGIYDREYYRREGPSFISSLIDRGKVCKYLIAINVVIFVIQLVTVNHSVDPNTGSRTPFPRSEGIVTNFLWLMPFSSANHLFDVVQPFDVGQGAIWQLLTYSFLHDTGNFLHIVFNMLFLWWFGREIEDLYGPKEFLAYYLIAAVFGGVGGFLGAFLLNDPRPILGASGAVAAVMLLYAFHYPTRIIYFWFIPMPIWVFVAIQVGLDAFGFINGMHGFHSSTAVTVHLAGAAFGFAYFKLQWRMMNWLPDWRAWRRSAARRRSNLRVYREEEPVHTSVAVAAPPPSVDVDEQLEAKLDAVLQKVSKSGKESLTETERQILVQASEVYKRRRT